MVVPAVYPLEGSRVCIQQSLALGPPCPAQLLCPPYTAVAGLHCLTSLENAGLLLGALEQLLWLASPLRCWCCWAWPACTHRQRRRASSSLCRCAVPGSAAQASGVMTQAAHALTNWLLLAAVLCGPSNGRAQRLRRLISKLQNHQSVRTC